jgi:acyl carrier protein
MTSTFKRLAKIIEDHLGVTPHQHSHFEDLGADSLDTIAVLMAVEKEFDIEIPEDAALDSIQDLIKFIESHSND